MKKRTFFDVIHAARLFLMLFRNNLLKKKQKYCFREGVGIFYIQKGIA